MTRRTATRQRAATRWVLPGLAFGLLFLVQGCAGLIPGKESATADGSGGDGTFQVRKGRPGIVIGTPPGASDAETATVAREVASLTGFGLVVVKGAAGRDPSTLVRVEDNNEDALSMYNAYRGRVADAAQGPLRLYVEVRSDGPRGDSGRLQIATVGLSADDAWRLKTLFELIRDARVQTPVPRLEVSVEPRTAIREAAPAVRPAGVFGGPRVLQIDLPRSLRTTYREVYTSVLAAFLTESVSFLVARER